MAAFNNLVTSPWQSGNGFFSARYELAPARHQRGATAPWFRLLPPPLTGTCSAGLGLGTLSSNSQAYFPLCLHQNYLIKVGARLQGHCSPPVTLGWLNSVFPSLLPLSAGTHKALCAWVSLSFWQPWFALSIGLLSRARLTMPYVGLNFIHRGRVF